MTEPLSTPLRRRREPPPSRAGGVALGLLRTARPRQWVKNVLVAAAPAAAGVLLTPAVAARTAIAFAAFCLAASGTYCVNDALDAEADRQHPRKRTRPVAAGVVPPRAALTAGAVLLAAAVAAAAAASPAFALVVVAYGVLTVAYSLWLKHVAVIDLLAVSAGFVLRAASGGVAADVVLSEWFLIVTSFGALFVVTGKRHGEMAALGSDSAVHRATLARYTPGFTALVLTASLSITLVGYCLWAFEQAAGTGLGWFAASIVPCVAVLLRYAQLVHDGRGSDPVELVFSDRGLQAGGALWALTLVGALTLS